MTDLLVTSDPKPRIDFWSIPSDPELTGIPRGQVFFSGDETIPLKGAADNSGWKLNMPLPRGWIYRIVEARIAGFAVMNEPWTEGRASMLATIHSDKADEADWYFTMDKHAAENYFFTGGGPPGGMAMMINYVAEGQSLNGFTIDGSGGNASITVNWVDVSSDQTVAVLYRYRYRYLIYDVRQVLNWPMHAPNSVINP